LNDEEKKAFNAGGGKAALKTTSLNEVLEMGRGNIREQQLRGVTTAPGGVGPTLTKAQIAQSTPNVSIPAAPQRPAPKVVVTNVQDQSAASNPGSGSGSDVPVINASNGSQSNAKILGFLPGPLQLF